MKLKIVSVLLVFVFVEFSCTSDGTKSDTEHEHQADQAAGDETNGTNKPKSPRTASMAMIGGNHVHIDYSAPSVRGRTIWGGLVAYDQVWVTGAHQATSIQFDKDIKIGETVIPVGKYALFTIPGQEKWTIIINKNWEQHLADEYDPSLDVLRFDVVPESLPENVEQLTFSVESTGESTGTISISWEKIRVSFSVITVNPR